MSMGAEEGVTRHLVATCRTSDLPLAQTCSKTGDKFRLVAIDTLKLRYIIITWLAQRSNRRSFQRHQMVYEKKNPLFPFLLSTKLNAYTILVIIFN